MPKIQRKPKIYRRIIDDLVEMCHNGQGDIGAHRVKKGVWNQNATKTFLKDQFQINQLLKKLTIKERKVLAWMLSHEVEVGVFETLKILEQYQIKPFDFGYEGSPYNDFIGRVDKNDKWDWPE